MKLHDDQFVGGQFAWFTGVVEDINDTEYLNRVKVRAFGYHSDDTAEVPTDALPWATVMGTTLNAGHKGVGSNHQLVIGTWCVGFFRDGLSAQDPIIMGTVASSQPDGTLDLPTEAQVSGNTNAVYKSTAGHLIEIDNTLNASRIMVTHIEGTSILIDNSGNVTIDTSSGGNTVNIIGNTTITGTLHVSDKITSNDDIVADNDDTKISLEDHVHVYKTGSGTAHNTTNKDTEKPTDAS
jgi:hypothetical protein|tara:strand:- start:13027 stop:13740 length:714 start_codon:yes stop_codon:yes gene_type:complete